MKVSFWVLRRRIDSRLNVTRRLESQEFRCLTIQVAERSKELLEFELNIFLQLEGVELGVLGA